MAIRTRPRGARPGPAPAARAAARDSTSKRTSSAVVPVSASQRAASPRSRRALAGTTASAGVPKPSPRRVFTSQKASTGPVPGDDVDLAGRAAPVAGDRAQPRLGQVPGRAPLAVRADRLVPLRHGRHGARRRAIAATRRRPLWTTGVPVDNQTIMPRLACATTAVAASPTDFSPPIDGSCTRATGDRRRGRPGRDGAGVAGRIRCRTWTDDGAFRKIRSRAGTPTSGVAVTASRSGAARANPGTGTARVPEQRGAEDARSVEDTGVGRRREPDSGRFGAVDASRFGGTPESDPGRLSAVDPGRFGAPERDSGRFRRWTPSPDVSGRVRTTPGASARCDPLR